MKFCPDCGERLDVSHKYCPNCGSKIKKQSGEFASSSEKTPIQPDTQENEFIVCFNCGEENNADSVLCESCGIKLDKEGTKPFVKKSQKPGGRRKVSPSSSVTDGNANKSTKDELAKTKVIYVAAAILAIVMFILYTSGIFDSAPSVNRGTNTQQQDFSSGVNMNNLQRINEIESQYKANPDNTELLLELAHLKNDSGLYENAIQDYQKYLNIIPSNADARIDMGVCYYNLRQYDRAMEEMKKALEYNPSHQIGHLNLGIVNLAAGNLEESKKWLSKAVSINPNSEIGKKAQELLQSH